MRGTWLLAAAALLAPAMAAQDVAVEVRPEANGTSTLVHALEVAAPLDTVWAAFATSEGLMSWAVPFAAFRLEAGAESETSYDPAAKVGDAANIRTRVLAFVPRRMLAMKATAAPPGFPHPEVLPDLFSVVELDSVAPDRTRIVMYGVGYRDTPAHRAVLEMFREANRWSLAMLVKRFTDGPTDWSRLRAPGSD